MILDALSNADRYQHLHPRFALAFAWARDPANRARANGEYELLGRDLYVMMQNGQTMAAQEKRFESHRRYIDIQLNLEGGEIIEWTPSLGLAVSDDFRPDNDIRFHAPLHYAATSLVVRPDEFAIFWPEDAHKPGCHPYGAMVDYRKMVFKVDHRMAR